MLFADIDDPQQTMEAIISKIIDETDPDFGNGSITTWQGFREKVDELSQKSQPQPKGQTRTSSEISVLSWRKFKRIVNKATKNDDMFANRANISNHECRLADAIKHISSNDVYVIDIAKLPEDKQAFVFGDAVRTIYNLKLGEYDGEQGINPPSRIVVFIDELNKYASKDTPKTSPILREILDVTERGRSLGVVLFGAEQFRSNIHQRVTGKDLSRLGRNYIEAGSYIEIFFPRHNVRYIAVTDGVDSLNRQEMDITPFKNILNDMYSRDISKKVLAGWMARSRQGKFLGGPTPYGLMRDPADHGHLIIDPETAPTVKLVFDLAADGYGMMRIAKYLLEHKIPITRVKGPIESEVRYYSWGSSVISKMLRNPVYKGDHVVCKCHQKAIRSNTINKIPRDEWEIIENCREAIVSREQWDRVQKLIDRRPTIMQGNSCPFYNLFHGLVYCATCGKSMEVRYEKVGRTDIDRSTKKKREPIDRAYYICQTYNRLGKKACTSHKIEARDLYNLVLADIIEHGKMALQDAEAFYGRLTHRLEQRYTIHHLTMLQ